MMANIANGSLPTNVTVFASGREVVFTGWPYRVVLWGVWQFLNDQGVRWVYPDAQGDYVPTGAGVNLSMLPIKYIPSTTSIYANFVGKAFAPWATSVQPIIRQSYLYLWRNFWNGTQGSWNSTPIGGLEMPTMPSPGGTINSNYTEGFDNYPHNFGYVIPNRILYQHPEWFGWTNAGDSTSTNGSDYQPVFQVDNPTLISWVATKLTNIASVQPLASRYPLNTADRYMAINLLPIDTTIWSQDPYTLSSNAPFQLNPVPYGGLMMTNSYSGAYYSFVNAVANQAKQWGYSGLVGALAYSDVFAPPAGIPTFPTNVWVEVCLYGAANLPLTAPANSAMKTALNTWRSTCSNLASYDYALLYTTYSVTNLVTAPLVNGIVGTAKYLASLGMLNGECQATPPNIQYDPWNFYAYPQIRWNTNQTAGQIETNFFEAYFRESAAPMLAYYQDMESWQSNYDINMDVAGNYHIVPGSFPLSLLNEMQTNLALAESEATNWVTVSRIANSTNSFNYLVDLLGLAGTNLANPAVFPTVPTTNFTVNLSNMVLFVTNTSGGAIWYTNSGGYWIYWSKGTYKQILDFPQAGTYAVNVRAYAVPSAGIYPVLTTYLGPNNESQTITSSSYTNYSYVITVPYPGAWDLVLQYQNDAPGGARQIYINQIQITQVGRDRQNGKCDSAKCGRRDIERDGERRRTF
jgi:Domain of unknown function (DUF4838)